MARERKIRRKKSAPKSVKQTPAQEQRKIERLLGEEFDSLKQARAALKRESIPLKKSATKPAPKPARKSPPKSAPKTSPSFDINTATRQQKSLYAKKIGVKEYYKRLRKWEQYRQEHEEDLDLQPDDNPYFYHEKGK